MTKQKLLNFIALGLTAILAAILLSSLALGVKRPPAVRQTEGIVSSGGDTVTAVRISDVGTLCRMQEVGYAPDEFLFLGTDQKADAVTPGDGHTAAKRGTYRFVLLNLEPSDEDFEQQAEKLTPYLQGDNKWHFTLFLPKMWSACAVYVNTVLTERVGEISNYSFADYCGDFQGVTDVHKNGTQPLFIDLSFYTRRESIPANRPLWAAKVVTVHYETTGNRVAGLTEVPLIGLDSEVRAYVNRDRAALSAAVVIAALALAVFIFLCFLKHTLSFLPQLLIALGVFGTLFSELALLGATVVPFVWQAVSALSFAFIAFSACFSVRVNIKKFPVWAAFAALALCNCIVTFVAPFVSVSALGGFALYRRAANLVLGAGIVGLCGYAAGKKTENEPLLFVNPMLAGIMTFAAAFFPGALTIASPLYWLCAVILAVTVLVSFRVFVSIERRNKYLTANLQGEVDRQTKGMQAIIDERDNLLRRVSHDMKKPAASIGHFLGVLEKHEADAEQLKTIRVVKQKTNELLRNFNELSDYAKLNFVAERSSIFDVDEVLRTAYENLEPDCAANGIVFSYVPASISVFGKRNCLVSVLNNIILNALEHSGCKTIALTAVKKKSVCHITVTDDGKGIAQEQDIFQPYASVRHSEENEGIGLYICKSMMASMGGDLSYIQENGKLTFTVFVPIA